MIVEKEYKKFYCKDCGAFLMESEVIDGHASEPEKLTAMCLTLKDNYCMSCGSKRANKLFEYARELGFDL